MDRDTKRTALGVLAFLAGIFALGTAVQTGFTAFRLSRGAVEVQARVEGCSVRFSKGSSSVHLDLSYFDPTGGRRAFSTTTGDFTRCEGLRSVPLLYASSAPDVAMLRTLYDDVDSELMVLLLLAVVGMGGGWLLFAWGRGSAEPSTPA